MKVTIKEVFPTLFYEFIFSQDEIIPLCKEMENKKEKIKKLYSDEFVMMDYWTDYRNPITLLEYEKLIQKIPSQFISQQLTCEHDKKNSQYVYWTAIYGERGYHETHNHNESFYDILHCNMSSILYLSDIGHTEFFNPRQSDEIHSSCRIPSKMGKMIMFPSHMLHRALPHGKKDAERIIVSSNWRLFHFVSYSTLTFEVPSSL